MARYTVELNYDAKITVEVFADNEGDALDRARDKAEDADIRQFTIANEGISRIINVEG